MKTIWKTKDGTKIKVKDMDNRHLLNTMKMIERNAEKMYDLTQREGYSALVFIQGEMAELAIESSLESMEVDDFLPEIYTTMLTEAYKRKLV